jgi:hypothetical protein
MAEISFDCVVSIKDMGAMLGGLTGAITMENEYLVDSTLDLAEEVVKDLLTNCPHPPNVTSDQAPPRRLARQLRELRSEWRDQTSYQSVGMIDSLNKTLDAWLAGMMGATPSASFYGGGVPGTMPTGEPTWMADPYQVDTSGQFLRKYPSAWRNKKARTRVTSQKSIGAKI